MYFFNYVGKYIIKCVAIKLCFFLSEIFDYIVVLKLFLISSDRIMYLNNNP